MEAEVRLETHGSIARLLADPTDSALVEAIGDADAGALAQLYDRYAQSVYALAVHLLGDHGAADEVVQETFVKLWRRPSAYRPDRGKLQPWLLSVAHHHALDLLRRRQLETRHRASPPSMEAGAERMLDHTPERSVEVNPEWRAQASEQRQRVLQALNALPANQRTSLELAYYQGLTQAEIAERLGEPLGTVKTRLRLALRRLRSVPSILEMWRE